MADASTDTPGLLESAMAFIRGETVAKSSLLTAQARANQLESDLAALTSRVKDLEAEKAALDEQLVSARANITDLTARQVAQTDEIATLKATAMTGARQAASILARVGIDPVATVTETARDKTGEKTFGDLVADQIKAGQPKIKAIQIVMATQPNA